MNLKIGQNDLKIGQKIGYWTIIGERVVENSIAKYPCRCKCGTVKLVNENSLKTGKTKSCGCYAAELSRKRFNDLTGQTFGRLTVIKRAEKNKQGRICWECRCKCGTTCIVPGKELSSGKRKSCGCLKKKSKNIVDLTGKKFGHLTVIQKTEKRSYKGSVIWHCVCECGNETDVAADDLIGGKYVSCGCKRRERQKKIHDTLHLVDNTCIEYLEKRNSRKDNSSGYQGVQCLDSGRYRAVIGFRGKRYHLGYYDSFEEAVAARKEAEQTIHKAYVDKYYEWVEKAERDPEWAEANPLTFDVDINKELSQNNIYNLSVV